MGCCIAAAEASDRLQKCREPRCLATGAVQGSRLISKKKGDICYISVCDDKIIGAVWVRIMYDYGHVDDETPSLAISLLKEYRNYGIGTALMKKMLSELKKQGYQQASLSVQKINYAVQMYSKLGFEIIDENDEEYIMPCRL